MAGAGVWWHSRPAKTMVRPVTRLTYNGVSFFPTISPDGKLLAYQAAIGGPNADIWVQQIGGGKAVQITHEKDGVLFPAFSPDGKQIVYNSYGRVYEVSALGGDPQLITNDGLFLSHASGGSTIVFDRCAAPFNCSLLTIPRMGGTPVVIQPGPLNFGNMTISPDGRKLLAIEYRPGHEDEDLKRWWVIPVSGGKAEAVAPPQLQTGEDGAPTPWAWTSPDKNSGRQWVIFERKNGDLINLFRVAVTSDGKVTSDPEQLTFTNSLMPSVSDSGRMVFVDGTFNANLWSIPIDANHAQVTGDRQNLTQVEGIFEQHPSLSRDGHKVAFLASGNLVVKDLVTGRETQLARALDLVDLSISPDGAFVVYCPQPRVGTESDLYSISTAQGGSPRLVCRDCGMPRGFSSDGSHLLTQKGYFANRLDRIGLVEVATGNMTEVLSDPKNNLWHAYYSWDEKWMTFKMQVSDDFLHHRLYTAPVENFIPAGRERWIQLTNGEYNDDKPQLSPDGNTLYFTSNATVSPAFGRCG
jgi:tricorn protease